MRSGSTTVATEPFVASVAEAAGGSLHAVYAVGSLALDDFSERQSNVDLVVVADPPLSGEDTSRLSGSLRSLERHGRPAQVWFATWADLDAGGPGSTIETSSGLATPMTRAILRRDPMALFGPDWPVVALDDDALRSWARVRLDELVHGPLGSLLLRRHVTALVLEAARLAEGVITGRVLSKSEAGEAMMSVVSTRQKRLLTDSVGYRRGAQTSMYWGPFERKYDALALIKEFWNAARSA